MLYSVAVTILVVSLNASGRLLGRSEADGVLARHNRFRRHEAKGLGLQARARTGTGRPASYQQVYQQVYLQVYPQVSNMLELQWSASLAALANRQAVQFCVYRRDFARNPSTYAVSKSWLANDKSPAAAMVEWFAQKKNYDALLETCRRGRCQDYVTISTAELSHVGCALWPSCQPHYRKLFICFYKKSAVDRSPERVLAGAACSRCPKTAAFCQDGLCVSCDRSKFLCDCRKTCRKPGVGVGRLNWDTCTCNCTFGQGANCDVECVNPENFVDHDACAGVTTETCRTDPILAEFCPEVCLCRRHP